MAGRPIPGRVSAIIPAYNCEETIGRAIDSALAQTHPDVEVIAIDDGSTDGTAARLALYGDHIITRRQANSGRSRARNAAIDLATGEFVAFLDADDTWRPRKTELQLALLAAQPAAGLVYCPVVLEDEDGATLGVVGEAPSSHDGKASDIFDELVQTNLIMFTSNVLVRRSALPDEPFDERLAQGEDWHLWLSIAAGWPVVRLAEPLCGVSAHRGSYAARMAGRGGLDAHLTIMRDLRQRLDGQRLPDALYRRGLARAWFDRALVAAAIGVAAKVAPSIREAAETRPAFTALDGAWCERLLSFAALLDQTGTPVAEQQAFVESFIDAWPEATEKRRARRRRALSQLHAGRLFTAHATGDPAAVRESFWRAAWYGPRWLGNRGFVAIGARAWAGRPRASTEQA